MWSCGTDTQGLLTCKLAPSEIVGHNAINDITARAVTSTGIPVSKEPTDVSRLDGKRPGGHRGKSLA